MKKKTYLLTILIPAYNNYQGVLRIINQFKSYTDVSIYISDDSNLDIVSKKIENFIINVNSPRIHYKRRGIHDGAVGNWNQLLSMIDGEFFILVHHDEFFSNTNFIQILKEKKEKIDALILPVCIENQKGIKRYVKSWQQRTSIRLIFFGPFKNFIGSPTASLVTRSDYCKAFLDELIWNVDVEWYYRIISSLKKKVIFESDGSQVISVANKDSITSKIINEVPLIIKKEYKILENSGYKNMVFFWVHGGKVLFNIIFYSIYLSSFIPFWISRRYHLKSK